MKVPAAFSAVRQTRKKMISLYRRLSVCSTRAWAVSMAKEAYDLCS
jgi:hypothetical protein